MKYLHGMKLTTTPSPWYAEAKSSTRKRQVKWLKRSSVETYFQQLYDSFDTTVANFTLLPKQSARRRLGSVMHEFYLRPNTGLKSELQRRRRDHGLDECPYCGNPLSPDTLDHFLPKEDWPEYAIFENNLVPQCRSCAPIKGKRYYCSTHSRAMFLHPMYDAALSSVQFKINVSMKKGTPNFEVKFSAAENTSPSDLSRIGQHLKELHVMSRMLEFCVRYWSHWRRKVEIHRVNIKPIFRHRIGPISPNEYGQDWATAFMKGVLRDAQALSALNAKPPHPPAPAPVEKLIELNVGSD